MLFSSLTHSLLLFVRWLGVGSLGGSDDGGGAPNYPLLVKGAN